MHKYVIQILSVLLSVTFWFNPNVAAAVCAREASTVSGSALTRFAVEALSAELSLSAHRFLFARKQGSAYRRMAFLAGFGTALPAHASSSFGQTMFDLHQKLEGTVPYEWVMGHWLGLVVAMVAVILIVFSVDTQSRATNRLRRGILMAGSAGLGGLAALSVWDDATVSWRARSAYEALAGRNPRGAIFEYGEVRQYEWARSILAQAAARDPEAYFRFAKPDYPEELYIAACRYMLTTKDAGHVAWALVNDYTARPWASALIVESIRRDPFNAVGSYFDALRPILERSGAPWVPTFFEFHRVLRNGPRIEESRYYTFIDMVVRGQWTLEQALAAGVSSGPIHLQHLMEVLSSPNPVGGSALENSLDYAITDAVVDLNRNFRQTPARRFANLRAWTPGMLYRALVYAEAEVFESTFNGIFDEWVARLRPLAAAGPITDPQTLASIVPIRYRTFLKLAARYDRLQEFLDLLAPSLQENLMDRFVQGLEREPEGLGEAVTVMDVLTNLRGLDPRLQRRLMERVRQETERTVVADPNTRLDGRVLYGLLAGIMGGQEYALQDPWFAAKAKELALPNKKGISTEKLVGVGNVQTQRYYFYDDDDGRGSFRTFLDQYRTDPSWIIEEHERYVRIRSHHGLHGIHIYANRPGAPDQASSEITAALTEKNATIQVVVHRGHSFHAEATIKRIPVEAQIVYLGSCGGYKELMGVARRAPEAHVMVTKGKGTWEINDPFLKYMNETIRTTDGLVWKDVWAGLPARLRNHSEFNHYIRPDLNMGLLLIHAYNQRTGQETDSEPVDPLDAPDRIAQGSLNFFHFAVMTVGVRVGRWTATHSGEILSRRSFLAEALLLHAA